MMLQQQGVGLPPGLLGTNSGDAASAAAHQAQQQQESGGGGAGGGSFSEEERGRMEEGERNSGGNRWPRQETLALLKIRSDMDNAFRDSSLKGPLWDEVSRKLAELGYHRSAKKCKEKFENVYKYHKRTKDGRTSKADGKTYRFFDQLEALDTHPPQPTATTPTSAAPSHHHHQLPAPLHAQPVSTMPAVTQMPSSATVPIVSQVSTVPSMSMNPMITVSQSHANVTAPVSINPTSVAMPMPVSTQPMQSNHVHHFAHPNMSGSMMSGSTSSSSTSSDSEPPERRKKRKRKWKDFFGRLMKEVIDKQEELQMKFLDTLEKRERERMIREEAWRVQEMAKMSREHDLLVQERSIAAAKDAAVISFLQKITEQQNAQNPGAPLPQLPVQIQIQESTKQPPQQPPAAPVSVVQQQQQPPPQPTQQPHPPQSQPQIPQAQPLAAVVPVPVPAPAPAQPQTPVMKNMNVAKTDNGGGGDINMLSPSPSRWPKVEVQALIKLRTTLDMKYQENGPKGPLWEEISLAMRKLGYNRNAKRCKEKWENINKYYKKVKESSKKRPEDSKTCPYFHLLDAIYREKGKTDGQFNPNPGFPIKPESQMAPIMARPEQQWPLPQDQQQQQPTRMESSAMDIDHEGQNHDDEDDEEDEEEDEDEGAGYEIVTNTNNNNSSSNNNKASSMATIE